jgi:hypothetical protein
MNEDYERGCWCNIETILDIQTDYDKETFTSKCHRQRHEECPLQSLADYTKQVRKETIDDLAVSLMMHISKDAEFTVEEICNWLQKVKDQISTTEKI